MGGGDNNKKSLVVVTAQRDSLGGLFYQQFYLETTALKVAANMGIKNDHRKYSINMVNATFANVVTESRMTFAKIFMEIMKG